QTGVVGVQLLQEVAGKRLLDVRPVMLREAIEADGLPGLAADDAAREAVELRAEVVAIHRKLLEAARSGGGPRRMAKGAQGRARRRPCEERHGRRRPQLPPLRGQLSVR